MQPKSTNSDHLFGENTHLYTKNRHLDEISPLGDITYKRRKRTESITFRLEGEILDNLRQEAKRKDVSVNTLVSQIAKEHTSWHSTAPQAGFISVRKPLLIKLLENQDNEQVKSLARHVAIYSNKDFILMLRRKYNIHSALDVIETWIRISGYSYTHNNRRLNYSNMLHHFIIQHNMGMKWSIYLSELYDNLFGEFGVRNTQFDLTNSTLSFEIVIPIEEKEYSLD